MPGILVGLEPLTDAVVRVNAAVAEAVVVVVIVNVVAICVMIDERVITTVESIEFVWDLVIRGTKEETDDSRKGSNLNETKLL